MLATFLLSSNMGFKASMSFAPGGANAWWVSFPYYYNPQDIDSSGTVNTPDVCNDAQNLAAIFKWDSSTGTPVGYTCGGYEAPFNIQKGLSYQFVGDTINTVSWIAVGSHDPTFQFSFPPGGANAWWVSIPYHWAGSPKTSEGICSEAVNLAAVFKWDSSTGTPVGYTCGGYETPFNIDVFLGYQLVGNTVDTVTWTPSHY